MGNKTSKKNNKDEQQQHVEGTTMETNKLAEFPKEKQDEQTSIHQIYINNQTVEDRAFEVLKYAQKNEEYAVFGFIHEMEQILNNNEIIPPLVYRICLVFYAIKYYWNENLKSPHLAIFPDGITVENKGSNDTWQGIVSQIIFSSGRHSFEIHIINDTKTSNEWKYVFGVAPISFDPKHTAWVGSQDSWGYIGGTGGKCHTVGKSMPYGKRYGGQDTIKCICDFDKKTIEFFRNDKSQGIAFHNLNGAVRPVVSLTGKGAAVRICNVRICK